MHVRIHTSECNEGNQHLESGYEQESVGWWGLSTRAHRPDAAVHASKFSRDPTLSDLTQGELTSEIKEIESIKTKSHEGKSNNTE
jgi:hypothetical protein